MRDGAGGRNYATLQANVISYFAKNAGLKPDELLALHNPKIVAGEAPERNARRRRRTAVVRLSREGSGRPWLMTAFKKASEAAEGGTTAVTNRAEPAPENPAGQEAPNVASSAAKGGRTGVTDHAESAPPAGQEADNVASSGTWDYRRHEPR